ncbi:MAG: hemerythrin domain-containing protein [Candidatus Manganitrophus sp.]|nr:hemerythrin domain-containing protein [Candidatus Manganitrophus sp.]
MKATQLLNEEHKTIKGLIRHLKSCHDKKTLLGELEEQMTIHRRLEEVLFYPEVRKIDPALVDRSLQAYGPIEQILGRLLGMTGEEKEFGERVNELEQAFNDHVQNEEGILFSEVEDRLKGRLDQLGTEMIDLRRKICATLGRAA